MGVKGAMAGGHFVHDHSERKDVGAGVLRFADDLLGAPVGGGAEERGIFGVAAGEAGHAEVSEFDAAVVGGEGVGGVGVAVDYAFAGRGADPGGDVGGPGP